MNVSQVVLAVIALFGSAVTAWAMTVPVHRFKEFRPKSPRDIEAEIGSDTTPAQVVHATYRSAICPDCHHRYTWRDVVPVVSWFRGCPACGRRLPVSVPVLQLGVPIACLLTIVSLDRLGHGPALAVPFIWLVITLAAISTVDVRIWLIPYWMPWLASGVGLVLISTVSLHLGQPSAVIRAVIAGCVTFAVFFALWLVAPAKLGFSDVRLSLVIGLFLGWISPVLPVYGILFGSLIALGVGVGSMITGKGSRFAFGPALSLGALSAVWLAAPILG